LAQLEADELANGTHHQIHVVVSQRVAQKVPKDRLKAEPRAERQPRYTEVAFHEREALFHLVGPEHQPTARIEVLRSGAGVGSSVEWIEHLGDRQPEADLQFRFDPGRRQRVGTTGFRPGKRLHFLGVHLRDRLHTDTFHPSPTTMVGVRFGS
jgi:hypothetical protein